MIQMMETIQKYPKMTSLYIINVYSIVQNSYVTLLEGHTKATSNTRQPDALNEHMLLVSLRKVVGGIHHDISRTLGSFTKNHMATCMRPGESHETSKIYLKSEERIYQKLKDFKDEGEGCIYYQKPSWILKRLAKLRPRHAKCRHFVKGWAANRRQFWHSEPHCFALSRSKHLLQKTSFVH